MGESDVITLKHELKEAQKQLCDAKHGNIDDRLKKIEDYQKAMTFWLIGIMGTVVVQLLLFILNMKR